MSIRGLLVLMAVLLSVGASQRGQKVERGMSDSSESVVFEQSDVAAILTQELADGEAHIWYLGHCGWAIKTRTRFLIFDYWEQTPAAGSLSLANGRIHPEELQALDVYVFVTHDHGDHYDPTILRWVETIPNVTYIFGWDAGLDAAHTYFGDERETRDFNGMEVSTVSHRFDRIPEVAYLVKVDGLVLYHSGDHASTSDIPNETFTGNIDFFAHKQERVDLAFISTFGQRGGIVVNNGDIYTIEELRPRVVIPMHHGQGEDLLQRFADGVAERVGSAELFVATDLGDHFFYADGRVVER